MRPQFSILVPTYNQADFLKEALESLLAQSVPDWEAVVVNDGSTDHTDEILQQYAARDARIQVITQKNGGTAAALNTALSHARGTWICWLSSDDLFTTDKLAIHQHWFHLCPECKFFFTYFHLKIEATGQIFTRHGLWGSLPQRRYQVLGLLARNFVSGISICIHREVFERQGGFSEELYYGQDYERWLWISSQYPGIFIPEWTCISRNHARQGSELFPQACYYDTARAAIQFLSKVPFERIFPLCDLNDTDAALDALNETLNIALERDAFLYRFGITPILFFNCLNWIARYPNEDIKNALWNMMEERLSTALPILCEGAFAHMLRVMLLATILKIHPAHANNVDFAWFGQQLYNDMTLAADPRKKDLKKYFRKFISRELSSPNMHIAGLSVVVTCTPAELSWVLPRVQNWSRKGANVLLLCEGEDELAYRQGVYILQGSLTRLLTGVLPISFVIGLHTDATVLPVPIQHRKTLDQNFELENQVQMYPQEPLWKRIIHILFNKK